MIRSLYTKHQYLINLLSVLVLVQVIRFLDWLAWNPEDLLKAGDAILNFSIEYITFIPIILLMIISYQWAVSRKKTVLLWFLVAAFAVFGMALVLIISSWIEMLFIKEKVVPLSFSLVVRYSTVGFLIFLVINVTYYLTYLQIQSVLQKDKAHKAESLAKDVQLKMLRYQINPHFLFNVLNSVYTLIGENSDRARKLVLDMSDYYRYTLNKQDNTISIEKEVESVKKYLEIQKARFEENFEYDISLPESVKPIQIPSFLIHLLIENAVKYGTITEKKRLIIQLSISIADKDLCIKVSNTGKLFTPASPGTINSPGTSNGIENLKSRLSLYYDGNYSFSLYEEAGRVNATVEIKNLIA